MNLVTNSMSQTEPINTYVAGQVHFLKNPTFVAGARGELCRPITLPEAEAGADLQQPTHLPLHHHRGLAL